jgi:geranylgeranyl diphosphate synthase, type I
VSAKSRLPSLPSLEDYRRIINIELERFIRPEPTMPEEYRLALRAAVTSPGKRMRPTITLLTCEASGGTLGEAVKIAASIELLHTATLVYDDIVDEDELRRGQPSLHARFGNDLSMMIAGLIATRALFPIVENEVLAQTTLDTLNQVVTGQILDIRGDIATVEDYLNLISRKTAAMFQLSAELGTLCTKAPSAYRTLFRTYGLNVGIIFQIRDDVLDAIGNVGDIGKPVGSDLRNSRPSIVSILASEILHVSLNELPQVLKVLDSDQSIECIETAAAVAMQLCGDYIEQAESALNQLPPSHYRNLLQEILRLASTRKK